MRRLLPTLALTLGLAAAGPLSAASVDGIPIHFASVGTGPALVLVHGWTCDSTSWAAQVTAFSKKYRVITLDLPGHGQSGSPKDGKFSMDLFARAVEAVRAEAGAQRIVLVGHSMGAPVIRQYAHSYPEHVAGLVAVDGPIDMRAFAAPASGQGLPPVTGPDGLKTRETMIRSMFTPNTPAPVQQHVLSMMLAAPEATAAGAMAAVFEDPSIRWTDAINAPTFAIYAGTNKVPDLATVQQVVPSFTATQIAGTGHFVMMEKPDEFNRALGGFLDKIKY
jgi:pimeloyl-ACP methyl ester carboxylesterase